MQVSISQQTFENILIKQMMDPNNKKEKISLSTIRHYIGDDQSLGGGGGDYGQEESKEGVSGARGQLTAS